MPAVHFYGGAESAAQAAKKALTEAAKRTSKGKSKGQSSQDLSKFKSKNVKERRSFAISLFGDTEKKNICKKCFEGKNLFKTVLEYLASVPIIIRNFYIAAFLVSGFRPEWKHYIKWNPTTPSRPKKNVGKRSSQRVHYHEPGTKGQKPGKKRKSEKHHPKTVTDKPPEAVPHDHSECMVVRINVSGRIFQPQLRTLNQYPNTLLGDPNRLLRFYDPARDEFFFDRHRTSFEAIYSFYQTGGIIRKPQVVPLEHFLEEVKFYDLGSEVIKYLEDMEGVALDDDNPLPKSLLKRKIWLLFEHPESSYQSRIVAYVSVLAVCLSTIEFCLETMPAFCWTMPDHFDINGNPLAMDEKDETNMFDLRDPFFFTETICVAFFIFEYVIRFVSSPHIFHFIKDFSNLIDLVAIVPYFVNMVYADGFGQGKCGTSQASTTASLRIIRLVRVFRIFKLSRHNKGLKILGKTLKASGRELGLLMFFLMIGVVVFSSIIYFVETATTGDTPFDSIPTGFWFSIVTMTTLGYGDIVPITVWGKIVGALCAVAGVLTISLPVPVIVSNFNMFYNREELNDAGPIQAEIDHVEQCPFYPGWYDADGNLVGSRVTTNQNDSTCLQWLMGPQKPDQSSDSDFEDLKVDKVYKKTKKRRQSQKNIFSVPKSTFVHSKRASHSHSLVHSPKKSFV